MWKKILVPILMLVVMVTIRTTLAASTKSDNSSSEESEDQCRILFEAKPPQYQIQLIVFEETMVEAFVKCRQCGSKCPVSLRLVQTSLFSCAEPNANDLEERIFLIYII